MKLSEWKPVGGSGEIADELLPCRYLQYRWRVHHSFDISPYLGLGGGQIQMQFGLRCERLESVDTVVFQVTTLRDPLLGWVAAFYTYYPAKLDTTGPGSCRTFGSSQLDWWYEGPISGAGISEGWIDGWLVSPVYELPLSAGARVEVTKFFPCSEIPGRGWYLEVRTAGAMAPMLSIADPQVGDHLHFRIYEGVLLCQIWMSAHGQWHGRVEGLQVKVADNGMAEVSPGEAWVQFERHRIFEPALVSVGNGRSLIVMRAENGSTVIEAVQTVPDAPATLLAIVEGGAVHQEHSGSVVALDVSEFGGLRRESGRFVVRAVHSGGEEKFYESTDFGLTWRAVE